MEVNCPAEVKVKKLGSKLILGGQGELEAFKAKNSRLVVGLKCNDWSGSRIIYFIGAALSHKQVVIFADDWADTDKST